MSTTDDTLRDRRLASIAERSQALPGYAQALFLKYRRATELLGRMDGSALRFVEEFLADLETAFDAQWEHYRSVTRSAGHITKGSGA